MLSLALRSTEFHFFHLLLSLVDRVSRIPRASMVPDAMRLYRENIALKAQLDALERQLLLAKGRAKRASAGLRAAQVFAYLLTRGPARDRADHRAHPPRARALAGARRQALLRPSPRVHQGRAL